MIENTTVVWPGDYPGFRFPSVVGFDTESVGPSTLKIGSTGGKMLNVMRSNLAGFSLADREGNTWYLPVVHSGQVLKTRGVRRFLRRMFEECRFVVAHNWPHDYKVLKRLRVQPDPDKMVDSMTTAWHAGLHGYQKRDRARGPSYGLKECAHELYGADLGKFDEVFAGRSYGKLAPHEVAGYAAADAFYSLKLAFDAAKRLGERTKTLRSLDGRFAACAAEMELCGTAVDADALQELYKQCSVEQRDIVQKWEEETKAWAHEDGKPLKISSSKDLQVLFSKGHWPTRGVKKTEKGAYKTDKHTIEALAESGHESAKLRMSYQNLGKIATTYTKSLVENAAQYPDGRLHPSINITGAATGRMSSSYPNIQNMPARTPLADQVRRSLIPGKGKVLVGADYSQIELRVAASLAGLGPMAQVFLDERDPHQETADALGVSRAYGKTINFLVLYGGTHYKLASQFGISTAEGKRLIDGFFSKFHKIHALREKVLAFARYYGYVETITGHRRYLPGIKQNSPAAVRRALNTVIQGSSADIMKMGIINCYNNLSKSARLSAVIHDEVIVECPEKDAEECAKVVQHSLESCYTLKVPLVAEATVGKNWMELK